MPNWASGRRLGVMRGARSSVFGRRPGALGTLLLFAMLLACVSYLVGPEPAFTERGAPLVGWAWHVVDGDTLDIEGQRVRLTGVDAPELGQTCRDARGGEWSCGSAAATRLRELVRGRELRCETRGHDRYGRLLASCRNGAGDVAATMVAEGLALGDGYLAEQQRARAARLGIWQGDFVAPAEWRREAVAAGAPGALNPSRVDRFLAWLAGVLGN